jgi:branched-chain amino acid transport system substrate-binding protein
MRRVSSTWPAAALAALLALTVAACGGDDKSTSKPAEAPADSAKSDGKASGDPIVIGIAAAQSGFLGAFDGPGITAAEIARDEINDKGGVLGRPLKFVYADTKSKIEEGANAGVKVLDDGAEFVVVTCDFDFGAPAAGVAEKKGIVSFSLCAGSPKFGVQGVGPHAYTMGTGTPTEGATGAQWALKEKGFKSAFVLTDTSLDYNKQFASYFKRHFGEGGGKVAGEDTFKGEDPSVASQINRIRGANADVIVIAALMPGAASAVRQIRAAGIDTPIIGAASSDGDYWLEAVPDLSEFYLTAYSSIFGDDPNEEINRLVKVYEDRTGEKLAGGSFATGYSVIEALAAAMEKAGTTDSAKVKEALDAFSGQELLVGPTTFTPEIHMSNGRPMRIMQIQGGKPAFLSMFTAEHVEF